MIIRTIGNLVYKINTHGIDDDKFLAKNITGGFSKVASIPESNIPCWKLDVDGVSIIVDIDRVNLEIDKRNIASVNQESLNYLAETDYYVTRFAETGVVVPQAVLDKRATCRSAIV